MNRRCEVQLYSYRLKRNGVVRASGSWMPGWKSPSPHRPPGRAGHHPSPPGRPARCSCTHRHRATPRAQGEAPSATPFGFAPPKRKGKLSYTVTALLHKLHSFQSKLVWCVVYPMICLSVCLFLNWRVLSAFGTRDGARGGGDAGGMRIDQEHRQKRALLA